MLRSNNKSSFISFSDLGPSVVLSWFISFVETYYHVNCVRSDNLFVLNLLENCSKSLIGYDVELGLTLIPYIPRHMNTYAAILKCGSHLSGHPYQGLGIYFL